jgi:hypothetical protein
VAFFAQIFNSGSFFLFYNFLIHQEYG